MVVTCENCRARFNLAEKFIKPAGTTVRCSKCLSVFSIVPPETPGDKPVAHTPDITPQPAVAGAPAPRHQLPTIESSGSTAVITLPVPVLDINNTQEFTRHIEPVLADHTTVIVDLSAVEFVDSSGCGVILRGLQAMKAKNGNFMLCCASPQVRATFHLMRLDRLVDIAPSKAEALELTAG